MPWLRFTTGSIATTNSIDCCERVNTGPIIIVWREPEPAFHRLQGITPDRTGIVARLATYDKLEFAIPAYQSITGVAVIRVDPRFARAAVGDSVDLEVTLMDTRKSDEESAETIPESDLKGGVGASAGNKPCGAAQDAIQPLPK